MGYQGHLWCLFVCIFLAIIKWATNCRTGHINLVYQKIRSRSGQSFVPTPGGCCLPWEFPTVPRLDHAGGGLPGLWDARHWDSYRGAMSSMIINVNNCYRFYILHLFSFFFVRKLLHVFHFFDAWSIKSRKLLRNVWFAQVDTPMIPQPWLIQVERVRRNLNGLSDDDKASLVRTGRVEMRVFSVLLRAPFQGSAVIPCNWLVVLGNGPCWRLRRWTAADCSAFSRVFAGLFLWCPSWILYLFVPRGPEKQSQSFASDFFRKPEEQLKAMEEVRVCLGDPWSPTVPPLENDGNFIVQWVQWSGLWAVIFR